MYETLVGKQRALVFPIMCNAFATIDYSDNVPDTGSNSDTSDDVGYGIWAHDDSFTFEAIVTPYDINGYGTYATGMTKRSITASKKIMPALSQSVYTAGNEGNFQSEKYMTRVQRRSHTMKIFQSDGFAVSLVQTAQHNENQPAQYKIQVDVTANSTLKTVITDTVILPSYTEQYVYSNVEGLDTFDENGDMRYRKLRKGSTDEVVLSHSAGSTTIEITDSSAYHVGQTIYFKKSNSFDFEKFTVNSISSGASETIVVDTAPSSQLSVTQQVYVDNYAEPTYLQKGHHIAVTFNLGKGTISIYYEGRLVKESNHSQTTNFSFGNSDYYIGANGQCNTGPNSATNNHQFMGELHELAIMEGIKKSFPSRNNLLPTFDRTLLYLRFEEVDA